MKIAIPTNNGEDIHDKMLGTAKEFHIYNSDNKGYSFMETRINPYQRGMQHLKTLDIYEIIKDCKVIISSKIGKKGIERLKDRGVCLYFYNGKITEGLLNFKEDKCLN